MVFAGGCDGMEKHRPRRARLLADRMALIAIIEIEADGPPHIIRNISLGISQASWDGDADTREIRNTITPQKIRKPPTATKMTKEMGFAQRRQPASINKPAITSVPAI